MFHLPSILRLTQDLIAIPSVSSDIQANIAAISYIQSYFEQSKIDPSIYILDVVIINDKPSIYIANHTNKHSDILMSGHVDVVPVDNTEQYIPHIIDHNRLRGRGSADMKSSVAIMMQLMHDVLIQGQTHTKIALLINTDEEIGGFDGAKWFVDNGYTATVVLCPDGGSINDVVYAEKGIVQLKLTANGIRTHASKRWLGENAIDNIIALYTQLKQTIEQPEHENESDQYRTSTVNLTNIQGGVGACNVIPDTATGTIDIRFTQQFTVQSLQHLISQIANDTHVTYTIPIAGEALYSDPTSPYIQQYLDIAQTYCGTSTKLIQEHCACDARFFGAIGSIVILHQPRRHNIHGVDERVQIDDFEKLYHTFYTFIASYPGIQK